MNETDKYEIALQNAINVKQSELHTIQRKMDEACAELNGLRNAQNIYAKYKPDAPQLR